MKQIARRLGVALLLVLGAGAAQAQNVSLTGGTYSQNFDTLSNTAGSTTNTALPTGWQLTESGGGARDNEQYAVDTGSSNTGDTYSYGSAGSTERAFGSLRSGTLISTFGACFTNNTGGTISSLAIAYTGEQWRLGTAARSDSLGFEYSLNATSLTTGAWTSVATLNFSTPNTATTGAKDGNAAANRTALSDTIGSLSIANGASFCIRWLDGDASGADDGLAVDDFSITPNGGPGQVALSINDVTQMEGNSGTTLMTFTVSLSAPAGAGGVSFDIATADGTATSPSDFEAKSLTAQTIPAGSTSYSFSVTIYGDTANEPNEGFFVNVTNVTGAVVTQGQGLGSIQNDDITIVPIHDIQGAGLGSPLNGASVTTEGIVTALKFNNGFFLQTADAEVDADPATSEGIFVFTSTAPPAAAAIGNRVRVTATVSEFTPGSNLNQLSITELVSPSTIIQLSSGNPLPAPVVLASADFNAASDPGTAEKFEGMRVSVPEATVVEGSEGNITESSATASSTGVFQVVLAGVGRPYREPGIGVMDVFPIPPGKTPPLFDTNQERLMVRSRGQVGATAVALDAGATVTGMVGVLDYFAGTWALLPDNGTVAVAGGKTATAVTDPGTDDVTIAGFNLLRFFDEVNDSNGAPTLTAAAVDKRLTKTSTAICDYLKAPDILGVVEVENLRVLGLLADRINATCGRAPTYVPYLVQGNDPGGINVGFLVNTRDTGGTTPTPRVEVLEVTQYGKNTLFTNPDTSTALLNDRPPLMLRAVVHADTGASYPVTVFVNHLRSLNGIDDTSPGSSGWPTEGDRVRNKRAQQAVFLANLVNDRQVADPNEKIVLVGDFNAFEFNDGYADIMGIVRGDQVPENEAITWVASPVATPLVDGSDLIADPAERYSYVFEGSAQTLDHVVVNEALVTDAAVSDAIIEHARINADFGVHNFGVAGTAIRTSDHDPVRLSIRLVADSSGPEVGYTLTPAAPDGDNGWHTSDVGVHWTVVDPETTVTTTTGCEDSTLSSDTAGATYTCSATSSGGTTSVTTVSIKRDATAPTLAPTVPATILVGGSYSASPNASDATSGIANASCDPLDTSSTGTRSTTCTATDNAGNVASVVLDYTVTTTCANDGYTGTKLQWCQNICEKGYTGSTLESWIHRWTNRYRDLPYCLVNPQPSLR
ncbi:Calx-beta domain-containing protein [Thermomonas sp.]|uniref:Calx-beta domain-containing protein n=1 Tax=Thermomonas sp. TaxID=1971895 RepID=UPI0035B01988